MGLQWSPGTYDGASPVIDYQVSYAVQSGSFAVYSSNVVEANEIVTGLTPGQTYEFKIEARNVIGLSEYSSVLTVLAAQEPGQP